MFVRLLLPILILASAVTSSPIDSPVERDPGFRSLNVAKVGDSFPVIGPSFRRFLFGAIKHRGLASTSRAHILDASADLNSGEDCAFLCLQTIGCTLASWVADDKTCQVDSIVGLDLGGVSREPSLVAYFKDVPCEELAKFPTFDNAECEDVFI